MVEDRDESIWRARLRWRMRGAWQGPTFASATLAEAILLNRLPIAGDHGAHVVGAFLLCGFFNLAVVAVAAPLLTRGLRLRRPSPLPLSVYQDRVGTSLLGVMAVALLAIGIGHRSTVVSSGRDYDAQLFAVRAYLAHQAPPQYRSGIGQENVWKQKTGFFRTCVPGPDPDRSFCMFVNTVGTVTVTPDPDMTSNSRYAGPENPGRMGG